MFMFQTNSTPNVLSWQGFSFNSGLKLRPIQSSSFGWRIETRQFLVTVNINKRIRSWLWQFWTMETHVCNAYTPIRRHINYALGKHDQNEGACEKRIQFLITRAQLVEYFSQNNVDNVTNITTAIWVVQFYFNIFIQLQVHVNCTLLPYNDCGFLNIYPFLIIILFIFRIIFLCKNPGFTSQNKILTNTTFTTDTSIFSSRKTLSQFTKKTWYV